ncbi:putative transposase rhodnius neglectus [Trichonephila clavipes]|nr:putative transposase rhodnius neglectus [Trichonephila clavipes]
MSVERSSKRNTFVELQTFSLGSYIAVINFNKGFSGLLSVLEALNIKIGSYTLRGYAAIDQTRIEDSKRHSLPSAKKKKIRAIKKRKVVNTEKHEETSSVENKPRPGGPSKLTSRAKRMIVRSATNKQMTSAQNIANELLSSFNVSVPAQTVRNVLHSVGLKARTPRKKPYISEVNRKRRLEFAMKCKNKPMDFWKKVIFSDESKSEIFTPPSIGKI